MKTANSFKHFETTPARPGKSSDDATEGCAGWQERPRRQHGEFRHQRNYQCSRRADRTLPPIEASYAPGSARWVGLRRASASPSCRKSRNAQVAELRIVHVDTTFEHPYTRDRLVQDKIVCDYCVELERQNRAYLERIAEQIRTNLRFALRPVLLNSRNVVAAMLDAIGAEVDLVIMAAYGKGLIRRWVSGSTAHELIHQAAVPVLIVGADGSSCDSGLLTERDVCLLLWTDREAQSKRLDQHWRLAKSMRRNTSYCAWYRCQHSTVRRRPGMAAAHLMMDSERSNWRQLAGI